MGTGPDERPLTVRQLVAAVLERSLGYEASIQLGDSIATELDRQLRTRGLAIHEIRRCVRPPADALGRPMTEDDRKLLGLRTLEGE